MGNGPFKRGALYMELELTRCTYYYYPLDLSLVNISVEQIVPGIIFFLQLAFQFSPDKKLSVQPRV